MITLRPHQDRILYRMLAYNKGQMIVPTGGGKTLTMIVDTQRRHDVINNGTTTASASPVKDELPEEQLQTVHDKQPPAYPDLTVAEYLAGPKSEFGRVAVANPATHGAYQDSFTDATSELGNFYQNIETHQAPDYPIVSVHCCMFICYCR